MDILHVRKPLIRKNPLTPLVYFYHITYVPVKENVMEGGIFSDKSAKGRVTPVFGSSYKHASLHFSQPRLKKAPFPGISSLAEGKSIQSR